MQYFPIFADFEQLNLFYISLQKIVKIMTRPPPGYASRNFTDSQLSLTSRRRPPLPEMNQIQEKIKDLVDVRSNEQLDDFLADLSQTLSGYYFTDITSDLMAKWIDRVVVMPTGSGNAFALAGYR